MECSLSTFPFLTVDEFERACRALTDRCCTSACVGAGGWSMRLVTQNQQVKELYPLADCISDKPLNTLLEGFADEEKELMSEEITNGWVISFFPLIKY